jgi:hypothetical protein
VLRFVSHAYCEMRFLDVLERDDVVARLYICNTLADRFDDTSTLVPKNDGESTLGILSG